MNTTGIFTTQYREIPVIKIGDPFYLIPFGDIHRDSHLCCDEKWLEFLAWAKTKKRCLFLGMGDYNDLASASERHILTNRSLHESTKFTIEDIYRKESDKLSKELSFMKGKLLGLMEGNHYGEFQNDTTTTQRMCDKLDCKYLGVSAFIRLAFVYTTHRYSLDVWAHHGRGAARLIGGSLNKVQNMSEAAVADIYLMGHDHKKSVGMSSRLTLSGMGREMKVRHKKMLFARTGSFLKAYEENRPSYVADMAMNPSDLGVIKIELTPKRECVRRMGRKAEDRFYIDIHGSL